jgi:hypothetical protein
MRVISPVDVGVAIERSGVAHAHDARGGVGRNVDARRRELDDGCYVDGRRDELTLGLW